MAGRLGRLGIGVAVLAAVATACVFGGRQTATPIPSDLDPGAVSPTAFASASDAATVAAARDKIKHVVFLIKENRTFDTMFGTFPGADGATEGQTCDGQTLPLGRAADRVDDAGHSFADGITAINGGRMDCFDPIGFVQYQQADIPNYWSYAQHFTLADRVLLLDLRADRRRAPVDVRLAVRPVRRSRAARAVRHRPAGVLRRPERARLLVAEGRPNGTGAHLQPGGAGRRRGGGDPVLYRPRWPCTDVTVLPDRLEAAGLSWKEYLGENEWVQPLRMVRHVRFSSMYDNVVTPGQFLQDVRDGTCRRSRG